MKPHYFDQDAPDEDDADLRTMIGEGVVPPGCLFGGSIVVRIHNLGDDPCAFCPGPREKCGGRPIKERLRTENLSPKLRAERLDQTEAAYQKQRRADWIRTIKGMLNK